MASLALFALGSPAAALAAGNPATTPAGQALTPGLGPQTPAPAAPTTTQPQQIPVAPVTTSAANGGSVSGSEALLLGIGAVIVLAFVAFFIVRDSRHHARLLGHAAAGDTSAHRGSKARPKSRKLSAAEKKRRKRGRARAR